MVMTALAFGLPSTDIESFSSWEPVLAKLFRSSRDKSKLFTWTFRTLGTLFLTCDFLLMILK